MTGSNDDREMLEARLKTKGFIGDQVDKNGYTAFEKSFQKYVIAPAIGLLAVAGVAKMITHKPSPEAVAHHGKHHYARPTFPAKEVDSNTFKITGIQK